MTTVIKSVLSIPGPRGPAGIGGAPATPETAGAVQLAGALGGTAVSPTALGFTSRAELDAHIIALIAQHAGGGGTTDPVTFITPGYVEPGYVV